MKFRFLALLCFFFLFTFQSFGENNSDICIITAPSGASMRAEPRINSKKLAHVPAFAEVNRLEWSEEHTTVEDIKGCWNKVAWQGKEGYIFAGLLCSNPEEMRLVKAQEKLVKREMDRLTLTLNNGSTVVVKDKPVFGEASLRCRFKGMLANQSFFVIEQAGWEWGNILLINTHDGRQQIIDSMPIFSPTGDRFVTTNWDLHASYTSNRIQIFSLQNGMGNLEWSHEPIDWGPENAIWESPTRIRFTRKDTEGKETPAAVEFNEKEKTWHLL